MLNVTVILLSRDLSLHPLHHQAQNNINPDCFHTTVTVTQVQQKSIVDGWLFPRVICVGDCNILEKCLWKISRNSYQLYLEMTYLLHQVKVCNCFVFKWGLCKIYFQFRVEWRKAF